MFATPPSVLELSALISCLAAAVVVMRGGRFRWLAAALATVSVSCAIAGLVAPDPGPQQPASQPSVRVADPEFAGSQACRACHPGAYSSWQASFHRTMTQKPTPAAVLGRFDGVAMQVGGRSVRMSREGDAFFTSFPDPAHIGPDAPIVKEKIVLMTGAHHQQAYWFETGESRQLALAPVVWVRAEARWVPFEDIFVQPPPRTPAARRPTELKSRGQWNRSCIRCHTTQPRERFGDSDVAEHGIACEACHGPGRAHIARWRSPFARYVAHAQRLVWPDDKPASLGAKSAVDTIVQPAKLDHRRGSEICGQCHAPLAADPAHFDSEQDNGRSFRPGDTLAAHNPIVRGDDQTAHAENRDHPVSGLFFRDGSVRVSGREFAALARSACYQRGKLGCASCHRMHGGHDARDDQLRPTMRGDGACTGCHAAFAKPLAAAQHSRHPFASAGARCMNCHMANTAWGLLKATRDHEVRSPDVARDRAAGRPNACNLCHLDQTEAWAASSASRMFGDGSVVALPPDPGPQVAASVRWLLAGEPGLRALAAWHMAWPPALAASGRDWQAPLLALTLNDAYAGVRRRAATSLTALGAPPPADFDASATPAQRDTPVRHALARWMDGGDAVPARPTLLQDDHGRLNVGLLRALMRHADRRDVGLEE